MASEGSGEMKTSRLAQMQMRFQQRTQLEQEVRRRELLGTKTKAESLATGAPSAATTRLIGNGKVRQMFDERRRGAGIDRSNPLKPIGTLPSPPAQAKTRSQPPTQRLIKGISEMNLRDQPNDSKRITSDSNNNKYATVRTVNRNLKPVVTRKTPPAQEATLPQRSVSSPQRSPKMQKSNRLTGGAISQASRQSPPVVRRAETKSAVKKVNMETPSKAPDGTALCRHCGRHFNTDRLEKHEAVCQRMMNTKRKIFDASKQRVEGTEAEKYNKKGKGNRTRTTYTSAAQQKGLTTGVKKNNWRKKHEEFIQSIRAAKQVQQHLARGGKLSDLPPPPPSENPDYIQCPHCQRRFNQQAAERHIPKCADMLHNKPKNGPPPKRR
ncbi:zinc finger C2HC domain-containing protein 1C [Drosophila eugracilis]|uniref:zinc finger C2HC domain-containing protein 1C n=1 Tax=Drosophila eugracilis TaxID=29029 RepID=UPI001BD9FFAD|nr:zinc finger C2HC domain-containing protein 1C [Drosophila eugracilis]XP_017082276.2 zinc finger C2HC domain-containing protein 1C [Drosophila eugracilis]